MLDVTLQQLRVFREVAAQGTMAAAAESLGYTPSAISQAVSALERAVGHDVFERVGRTVRLTDLGRTLLQHADDLVGGLERAQVDLERSMAEPEGDFTMGVFESLALTVLAPLLTNIEHHHPALHLQTRELAPEEMVGDVQRGALDLAFLIDYPHAPVPLPKGLASERMLTERFRVAVPTDHPLVPGPVSLRALTGESLIAPPANVGCGRCIELACRAAGFDPVVRHQIDDYTSALRLVEAGLGLALVPDLGLAHHDRDVAVLELTDTVERQVLAVYRDSSRGRPALEAVLDATRSVFADLDLAEPVRLAG